MALDNNQQPLPTGYEFQQERLRVERVLGAGAFGITYLVTDLALGKPRVLKENFPREMVLRSSGSAVSLLSANTSSDYDYLLEKFIQESDALRRFAGHPNIAQVLGSFRANNTAYMLMAYLPGISLGEYLKGHDNKALEASELRALCLPVLQGLQAMHSANLLHLDIKPDNIYIPNLGEPYLIDFGGARRFSYAESRLLVESSMRLQTRGYAPPEQANTSSSLGPETDLYAFGATLYFCICGQIPPESTQRQTCLIDGDPDPLTQALTVGAGRYSPALLRAIDACLRIKRKERPQSVAELRALLPAEWQDTELERPEPPNPEPPPPPPPPTPQSSNKSWLWLAAIAVFVAAGWWGYDYWNEQAALAAEQAELAADQANWQLASTTHRISAYQAYLDNCASVCRYRQAALERMQQLRQQERQAELERSDKSAWQVAEQADDLSGYQSYLQNCNSVCAYRSSAEQRVEQLQERARQPQRQAELTRADQSSWQSAESANTFTAYQSYLQNCNSVCAYRSSAEQRVEQLQELARQQQRQAELTRADQSAWQSAESANTFTAYQSYLQNCNSVCAYRSGAEQRVEQLREFELTIRSNVYSDEVSINGISYGSTPVSVNLTRGSYAVRVSKDGYRDYVEQIEFTRARTLRVELKPLPTQAEFVSKDVLIPLLGSTHSDYTKLDARGNKLPSDASSWSCVLDNRSGLIWEVKTNDGGAHDKDNKYRWGGKGVSNVALKWVENSPGNKYSESRWNGKGNRYNDWNKLVDAANSEQLCGFSDWRVPDLYQLASLVRCRGGSYKNLDKGCSGSYQRPTIDTKYFPNATYGWYWSASPNADYSGSAWLLYFYDGGDGGGGRYGNYHVRLVRSGQ